MRKQNKDREKDRARSRDQRRKAKNQLRQYHSRPSPGVSYSNPSQLLPSSFLNQSNLAGIGGSVISRGQTSEPSGPGANKLILTMEKIARGQYKSLVGMNNSIITLRLDQRSQKEFMQCYQEVCIELNVKHLVLSNNDISSFRIFETIENLMTINLRNNRLKEFLQEDVVSKLPHLETLVMSENLIATLPEKSLTILSNKLRKLDLSSNCLTSLPSYITVLENLVKLDVSKNQISSLPQELLQWKLVENFHTSGLHFPPLGAKPHTHSSISGELLLRGNRFKEPHQRHFDSKGLSHLREYMAHTYAGQAHQTHHTSHLATLGGKGNTTSNLHIGSPYYPMSLRDYLKVVIVGHDGSGKSVIAMALKQFHQVNKRSEPHGFKWQADEEAVVITPEFRNETLENANTSYERSSVPIPHLKINLWDFMEKDVYQSSMDIFYSRHALHIVVWNVARASASHYAGQPAYHEVEYWINLIQARAPGSTTLIVATHTDLLSSERADYLINGCREYIGYQEVKRMSALQSEIDRCENEKEKFYLQQMLFERPCVVLDDIVRLTYANEEITGGLDLVTQIILLSHSSSLLAGCTLLPRANLHDQLYDDVKKALDMLRHDCNFACTIGDINTVIEKQRAGAPVFDFEDASDADKPLELDDDTLRDALTYWMQAGEIVYLYDPNLFETMEMQDEDEGEEISSASSKLTSQLVRTSLAGSTIHSETPPYSFSLEDRISTAQHSLVDGVEMAKDFSPSVAGVDDGSSCASSFPNLTVSDMVFISPNRFKKALLGILNKDPKAHIGELQ
ncbi:hypothetical protein EON65_30565 [archaeon]|nr:MAG: hypothetical protein EON65_30565 [archaeon]